ncbi:MAG: arsenate reductase ArsC [Verrucomicrobiota bacterium]
MQKKNILFICVHNSARSVMAEALCNHFCEESVVAQSAGLAPGKLNPFAVEALHEIGLEIGGKQPQSVQEVLDRGEKFDYVITVCSESEAEGCPIFPGKTTHLHWPFPDPSQFEGDDELRLARTRAVRNLIRDKVEAWCQEQGFCLNAA